MSTGTELLMLNKAELAASLRISLRTACRKLAKGEIPTPVRVGGLPRWPVSEIQQWIKAGCPSNEEWQKTKNFRQ
jgi:predicted DNA-binding transcriptional regulator AlpA